MADPAIDISSVEGFGLQLHPGRAFVHSGVVLSTSVPSRSWDNELPRSCGEVFEAAIAVVAASEGFLTRTSQARHLTFLEHLSRTRYEDFGSSGRVSGLLADDDFSRFGIAVKMWVDRFIHDPQDRFHPFAASWALDTAVLLSDLAFGAYLYVDDDRESWRLDGLISDENLLLKSRHFDRVESAQIKREVTMRLGGASALVQVPQGGKVSALRGGDVLFGSGDLMVVRIERCHLSSGVYDYVNYGCSDPLLPRYNLGGRFWFRCGLVPVRVTGVRADRLEVDLVPDESMLGPLGVPRDYMPFGEVPGDWIIASMTECFGDPVGTIVPMPWRTLSLSPRTSTSP